MTKRLAVLGALLSLLLSSLALTAPAANAAWTTGVQFDGAKLQLCKQPLGDGRTRVKVRLDNRGADHTHLGGFSRTRNGKRVDVNHRTPAGQMSGVKSLVVKRGDQLVAGMGEVTGEGAGSDFRLSDITRC